MDDIEVLRSRAQIRAAIGDVYVHIGTLIKMLRVIGVPAAHDGGRDNGINFNSGDAGTTIGDCAEHVHAAAGADDGKFSMRAQNIGQCRRRRHERSLPGGSMPARQVRVHDVCGRIGIDHETAEFSE